MTSSIEEVESDITPLPAARWQGRINAKFVYALLDQGVVSFGNMIVSAAVARNCASGDFGAFILALRSLDVINQVCGVLIWAPFTFNLPSVAGDRQRHYLGSALLHQISASGLGLLALLAFGAAATIHGSREYAHLFIPLALPSVAIIFREFTRRMYFAQLRFRLALILDTITVTLQVGAILLLIHRGAITPVAALWALSLSAAVVCLYWLVTEWRHLEFEWSDFTSDLSLNMQLGKWFFGSNMIFLGSSQVSPWLLSATSGLASVSTFAMCEAVVNIPRVALTSMQNAMAPTMARSFADGGKAALRRVVRRMDILIIGGSSVFAVGIIAFGPWIAHLIYAKSAPISHDSRLILTLLGLNLLAYGASLAQSYGLSAINRAELNFYAGIAGIVVQLATALLLVHPYGVPGVAFALLVGNSVVLAARIYYYLREMRRL